MGSRSGVLESLWPPVITVSFRLSCAALSESLLCRAALQTRVVRKSGLLHDFRKAYLIIVVICQHLALRDGSAQSDLGYPCEGLAKRR